ncbi:MAG: hypothetical protein JSU83_24790 [Deltaproteobacteria bacterium]|nr:MAG: hypothetical protein JSU83_24790 [Deltaproteobacteria bacterium]
MKKSGNIVCIEEWMREKENAEGYRKRRQKKDAYLKNPIYTHPVYGTPLMEPYKLSADPATVNYDGKARKGPNIPPNEMSSK